MSVCLLKLFGFGVIAQGRKNRTEEKRTENRREDKSTLEYVVNSNVLQRLCSTFMALGQKENLYKP